MKKIFVFGICTSVLVGILLATTGKNTSRQKAPKNVVLITIDTLRADHLRHHGYPRLTAPFIDSLARQGTVFLNAYSASSHTAPSHSSIFSSLYPFQHQVLKNHDKLPEGIYNLAQMAGELGLEVAGFPAVKFMDGKVGFPLLDSQLDLEEAKISKKTFWFRKADLQVDRVINWFRKKPEGKGFFIWLHFYDVHQWQGVKDFPKPEHLESIKQDSAPNFFEFLRDQRKIVVETYSSPEEMLEYIDTYDAKIRYVDAEIKRLHDFMQENRLNKETLWVLTADHGEGLGNHGYHGHGQYLYKEQLQVPLMFHYSGEQSGREVAELVRSVDIFPTLAEMYSVSLKDISPAPQGVSLLPLIKNGKWSASDQKNLFAFAERRPKDSSRLRRNWEPGSIYAIQDSNFKLIDHTEGEDEFFELQSDPFELNNTFNSSEAENKSTLIEELAKTLGAGALQEGSGEVHIDEEAVEELKTLGYL